MLEILERLQYLALDRAFPININFVVAFRSLNIDRTEGPYAHISFFGQQRRDLSNEGVKHRLRVAWMKASKPYCFFDAREK